MEPMLFHLEWDFAVEVLFTIIVLAFLTERARRSCSSIGRALRRTAKECSMSLFEVAMRVAAGVTVLALCACAGVTIHKEKAADNGIRYYEPAPFLLVYSDSKGGLISKVIWLPDTTRVMTLKPYAYFAKNESSFKFEKGVLTQAKSVADETVIPAAIVSALKTAAVAAVTAANKATKDEVPVVPAPYLYRIVITDGEAKLYASDRDPKVINVTLAQPPKSK